MMTISSTLRKNYLLQFACISCGGNHNLRLERGVFWGNEPWALRCPDNEVEVGYIGPENAVKQMAENGRNRPDSIANDLGFNDFFNHPEVMLGVLSHLHLLADNNNLTCQCGNRQIEVNVFPDKLELQCVYCDSLLIIYAETKEDLSAIRRMPRIIMSERGFASIDASKISQGR